MLNKKMRILYQPPEGEDRITFKNDEQIKSLIVMAEHSVQAEDFDHAYEYYDKVLEIKPLCIDAWIGIGSANLLQGRIDEAEKTFQKVRLMNPGCQRAIIGMALVCYERGNLLETFQLLRLADNTDFK